MQVTCLAALPSECWSKSLGKSQKFQGCEELVKSLLWSMPNWSANRLGKAFLSITEDFSRLTARRRNISVNILSSPDIRFHGSKHSSASAFEVQSPSRILHTWELLLYRQDHHFLKSPLRKCFLPQNWLISTRESSLRLIACSYTTRKWTLKMFSSIQVETELKQQESPILLN